MDNGLVSLSRMSLYFNQRVTCRAQSLSQLNSFARKERRHLLAESQMWLNGYSEESPARVAWAIRHCIHWMIHVQQNLGDGTSGVFQ
jgi:hypothetical protein